MLDGSPAEVWAVLVDHERWPRWFKGVKSCRADSDPAVGVGATRIVTLQGGTRFNERFIAWEEGSLWAFTATAIRPGLMNGLVERCTIAEVGNGRTRVTYRMAFEPATALRPLVPVLRRVLPGRLEAGMKGLAREVQTRRS